MSVYLLQRLRVPFSNDSVSLGSEAALLPGFLLGPGSHPVVIDKPGSRVLSPTADETKDLITATADYCYDLREIRLKLRQPATFGEK